MLNPINHARTRADVHRYKVEPYVVCADIYSMPPHVGRGGWTWYTGSAGWLQRAGVEGVLGLKFQGATLRVDPCIPKALGAFRGDARLQIRELRRASGKSRRRQPGRDLRDRGRRRTRRASRQRAADGRRATP